jgi:hypothetical protein
LTGIGEIPQARAAVIIDSYILAFFEQTLKNQPQPLLSEEKPPFPEVVRFQVWRPNASSLAGSTAPSMK